MMLAAWMALVSVVAQGGAPPQPAVVAGTVSSRDGAFTLPGATLEFTTERGDPPAVFLSDETGRFRVVLPAGSYTVRTSLSGFRDDVRRVALTPGGTTDLAISLELAGVSQHVDARVVAGPSVSRPAGLVSVLPASLFDQLPLARDDIESALVLFAGVIATPTGVSIRGAWRPGQTAVQLGPTNLADPATGNKPFTPPPGAVDTAEVMAASSGVDAGGYSAGMTRLEARRGGNIWQMSVAGLLPALRHRRDRPLSIAGLRSFAPRFRIGGPVIGERVWLIHSGQLVYHSEDLPTRSEDERLTNLTLRSYTRLDVGVSARHHAAVTVGGVRQDYKALNLDTFTPLETAADLTRSDTHAALTWTTSLSNTSVFEGTVHYARHDVRTAARGEKPLELSPSGNGGNYFLDQTRTTDVIEWKATYSWFSQGMSGQHLVQTGVDVWHAASDADMRARPIEIRRLDGTLAERVTFAGPTSPGARAVGFSAYAEDRWQLPSRTVFEAGLRVDVDPVTNRVNLAPRGGAHITLNEAGSLTAHAGGGVYHERTPLVAAAFAEFPLRSSTSFAADGVTPLGPATAWRPVVAPALRTPVSRSFSASVDYQVTPRVLLRAGGLYRRGRHEAIVEPVTSAEGIDMRLSSEGASEYRDAEVQLRYYQPNRYDFHASYVRAISRASLNDVTRFFGALPEPLIRNAGYAPTPVDVPHRLLIWLRYHPRPNWQIVPMLEVRSGTPFSAVDERQRFVGLPNTAGRFPTVYGLDLAIERRVRVGRFHPWIGIRGTNVLGRVGPRDVQTNRAAPDFGRFYSSAPIRFMLSVHL